VTEDRKSFDSFRFENDCMLAKCDLFQDQEQKKRDEEAAKKHQKKQRKANPLEAEPADDLDDEGWDDFGKRDCQDGVGLMTLWSPSMKSQKGIVKMKHKWKNWMARMWNMMKKRESRGCVDCTNTFNLSGIECSDCKCSLVSECHQNHFLTTFNADNVLGQTTEFLC